MEKKNQSTIQELKMPRLFFDDIYKIEKVIKDELRPSKYQIETKEYKYESLKEIESQNDAEITTEFHIQTYDPYIRIDFNRFSARVYTADDDLVTIGAYNKILKILHRTERKTIYWISKISPWITPPVIFIPIFTVIERGEINFLRNSVMLFIVILAATLWSLSYYYSLHQYSIIYFKNIKESPSFFKRNKDKIYRSLISAFIGAVIYKAVDLIFF